jgi:hypothetical protein
MIIITSNPWHGVGGSHSPLQRHAAVDLDVMLGSAS